MIYSVIVALLPFLNILKTPFINLSLGTSVSFLLTPYVLLKAITKKGSYQSRVKMALPFFLYIIVQLLLNNFPSYGLNNVIYMFINMGVILCCGSEFFDVKVARKTVEAVAVIASVYIIIQTIYKYYFGIILPTIPQSWRFLSYYNESTLALYSAMFRPAAFFLEPAQFAQYVIIGLASVLMSEKKMNYFRAVLLSIGIVCSTSGMGILLVAFVWMLMIINKSKGAKSKISRYAKICVVLLIILMLVYVLYNTSSIVKNTIDRILGVSWTGENAISGRTWSYMFYDRLDTFHKLFGVGYGNTSGYYMTSMVELLYYVGIFGTLTVVWLFIRSLYLTTPGFSRTTVLLYGVMILMGHLFTAVGVVFYLSFAFADIEAKKKEGLSYSDVPRQTAAMQRAKIHGINNGNGGVRFGE